MAVETTRTLDAEQAVLGALLIDETITAALLARVDRADFANTTNRMIFDAARALYREGLTVDAVTVRDKVGGDYADYLLQLMEITPSSASWETYADLMHQQAAMERARGYAHKIALASSIDECREDYAAMGAEFGTARRVEAWDMGKLLESFYQSQEDEGRTYIRYGLKCLDEGSYIEPGDVVVIGGYPSSGKTALSISLAYSMADKYRVGYFSLETNAKKFRDRLVSHAMQIQLSSIKQRRLDEGDWRAVAEKSEPFAKRRLTVLPAAGMSAADICATSQAYGFEVIFIDYIQLIRPDGSPSAPRSEQVAGISRQLHVFAQSTGTLVVELAQLSRPDKSATWREPDMHDLKESGQLEQDADEIIMIFRPSPKSDYDQEKNRFLKIAKNKEFRLGMWPLYFDGDKQTFSELKIDGKAVARKYSDIGKKARQSGGQISLRELTPEEAGELPL